MHSACYLKSIHSTLPRLLALIDQDSISSTYGVGDRYYWAWSLIDFANGTFQGVANGLARLLVNGLLPDYFSEEKVLIRIDSLFHGAKKIQRSNGSLEEAFPYEASFCVTALVAYDLLTAIELLESRITRETKEQYLSIVRPMIRFLHESDETHAFISNHLATAVAALIKWSMLTDEPGEERGRFFLKKILDNQSSEGWYNEYEGADPGYQSLCTYYLADVYRMKPDDELLKSLTRSIHFLCYFAHPDGSFGGYYGSRNTRFYYPAGIDYLTKYIPEAVALSPYMKKSIERQSVVTLLAMDEPNLIPMFNAYCWAASISTESGFKKILPCQAESFRTRFKDAGLLIDRGKNHYTIISTKKGGVVYHYSKAGNLIDCGLAFKDKNNRIYSTQSYQQSNVVKIEGQQLTIEAGIKPITQQAPRPWQFIILRMLNVSVMRWPFTREIVKQILVKMLITGSSRIYGKNSRTISLGRKLTIIDIDSDLRRLIKIKKVGVFSAIHMASQGYWQKQDD